MEPNWALKPNWQLIRRIRRPRDYFQLDRLNNCTTVQFRGRRKITVVLLTVHRVIDVTFSLILFLTAFLTDTHFPLDLFSRLSF